MSNIISLNSLDCSNNSLSLLDLYAASLKVNNFIFDTQVSSLKEMKKASVIDLSSELNLGGVATDIQIKKEGVEAIENVDYTLNAGSLMFLTSGSYTIEMSNSAIVGNQPNNAPAPRPMSAPSVSSAMVLLQYNIVDEMEPTGVSLSANTKFLEQGENFSLTATVMPVDADNKNVIWSSSNTAVATVSNTGVVTAHTGGTATITATTVVGNKTATCTVTVKPTVSITASKPHAYEGGATGEFTISSSVINSDIIVNYTVSGSAADYTASPALSGSITLTPAQPSKTITITAIDDTEYEGPETLILSLSSNNAYKIATASATLTIVDNDAPSCAGPVILYTTSAPAIDGNIDVVWDNTVPTYVTKRVLEQNGNLYMTILTYMS